MAKLIVDSKIIADDIELVIFDKDGTIFDIHHYWSSMIKLRAEEIVSRFFHDRNDSQDIYNAIISNMGVDDSGKRLKPEGPVGVKPRQFIVKVVAETIRQNNVGMSEERMEEIFKEIDKVSSQHFGGMLEFLPGAESFVKSCHGTGIKAAIATTDINSRAVLAANEMGIGNNFDLIIGGDNVEKTKPNPEMGLKILQRLGVSGEKAVMIGDHDVDMVMGKDAGIAHRVLTKTGLHQNVSSNAATIEVSNLTALKLEN